MEKSRGEVEKIANSRLVKDVSFYNLSKIMITIISIFQELTKGGWSKSWGSENISKINKRVDCYSVLVSSYICDPSAWR